MSAEDIGKMSAEDQAVIVDKIIERFGPVIDLRADPTVIIDIILTYRGAEEEPGHPTTGSIVRDGSIDLPDIHKAISELSLAVDALAQDVREIKQKVQS
jgi:hypothetical protein